MTVDTSPQPLATRVVAPPRAPAPPVFGYAPPPPSFGAGAVLGRTLTVWWRNVVPFTALSLVVYLPLLVLFATLFPRLVGAQPDPAFPVLAFGVGTAGAVLLMMALQVVFVGALSFGVFRGLRGGRVGIGALVAEGVRRFFPLAGVLLLFGLAMIPATILFLVPAAMLGSAWAAAFPACIVERTGPVESLARSAELTRGSRMQVFVAYLGVMAVVTAGSMAIQVIATVAATAALPDAAEPIGTVVLSQLGNVVLGPLHLVLPAVVYHDLRAAREGLDTGSLAAVFD